MRGTANLHITKIDITCAGRQADMFDSVRSFDVLLLCSISFPVAVQHPVSRTSVPVGEEGSNSCMYILHESTIGAQNPIWTHLDPFRPKFFFPPCTPIFNIARKFAFGNLTRFSEEFDYGSEIPMPKMGNFIPR